EREVAANLPQAEGAAPDAGKVAESRGAESKESTPAEIPKPSPDVLKSSPPHDPPPSAPPPSAHTRLPAPKAQAPIRRRPAGVVAEREPNRAEPAIKLPALIIARVAD